MTIGWRFDNTYSKLPDPFISNISPIPVKSPELIILNDNLGKQLGLNFSLISKKELSNLFSGNSLPEGSKSIAQAYAGHQFGHFTMLGDGRAVLMGEHISKNNERFDIQFKGSGQTPFSRNGDGRAALGPMLREYIISEAMHGLNIPTTRSLAVVKTGEDVVRENILQGAILTRVASSHLRVGTFQYVAMRKNDSELKTLVDYTINRHYPNIKKSKNIALDLLKILIELQIDLVVNWMRVGFIHGVMNTDNTSISGESFDYGPCAFINSYDPNKVYSSIDHNGRYSFGNQPKIIKWNITRFAESLLPIINHNKDKSIILAQSIIDKFDEIWSDKYYLMMLKKIGINSNNIKLYSLVDDLLFIMRKNNMDYTNTFCSLSHKNFKVSNIVNNIDFIKWKKRRDLIMNNNNSIEESMLLMKKSNPIVIPRNNLVQKAIEEAVNGDTALINKLLELYSKPYKYNDGLDEFTTPPSSDFEKCFQTYCGT